MNLNKESQGYIEEIDALKDELAKERMLPTKDQSPSEIDAKKIDQLEATVATLRSEVRTVSGALTQAETQVTNLRGSVAAWSSTVSQRDREIEDLKKELSFFNRDGQGLGLENFGFNRPSELGEADELTSISWRPSDFPEYGFTMKTDKCGTLLCIRTSLSNELHNWTTGDFIKITGNTGKSFYMLMSGQKYEEQQIFFRPYRDKNEE